MYSIIETPIFTKLADDLLSAEELQEFCVYIANNPEAGDVIPKSGSCRKVRWARKGMGKRGGTRIIYYNKRPLHNSINEGLTNFPLLIIKDIIFYKMQK